MRFFLFLFLFSQQMFYKSCKLQIKLFILNRMINWSNQNSQITLYQLKDITPSNYQYPTRYPCIICYERCLEPIKCSQCKQLICFRHLEKLNNKCPNCRLNPFKYEKDNFLKALAENQLQKQRDILISKATFTCLVDGCNFIGKYHKMDIHRRKEHRTEELKDILFPDERQKKKKKELLQRLFLRILLRKQQQVRVSKKAEQIYDSSHKKVGINSIAKMLWHVQGCKNDKCANVFVQEEMCFIGDAAKNISECPLAKAFLKFLDE